MMREWFAVAVGGILGGTMRHSLSLIFFRLGPAWLPIATLIANILGCFAIGVLAEWSFQQQLVGHWAVIGARVGLLGGLTTFSSFALDVIRLWHEDRATQALGLASSHLVLGLVAVIAGMAIAYRTEG